jgi:hypothetical protein
MNKQIAKLDAAAEKAVIRAAAAKQRLQDRCRHPFSNLALYEGAVETHYPGGDRDLEIRVECGLCGYSTARRVRFHND